MQDHNRDPLEQLLTNLLKDVTSQEAKEQIRTFVSKLDDYEIERQGIIETPKQSHDRVYEILGENSMIKHLYKDIKENKKNDYSNNITERAEFIKYLVSRVIPNVNNNCSIQKKDGEIDPRVADPNAYNITMRDLLDDEGLKLYEAAIKEERNSKNFRDAVLLSAANYHHGPKWLERMVLWVGGPSASGKTFNAEVAIENIANSDILAKDEKELKNNVIISVDGGIEREVSQMRQLVLQVALQKGYAAIKDLHGKTKLGIKSYIKKAALASRNNPSIVIPDTFANPLKSFDPKKIDNSGTKQIFAEIIGDPSNPTRFYNTTVQSGIMRASSQEFEPKDTTDRVITMNNKKIGCESKKYQPQHFKRGQRKSEEARKKYLSRSKDKIYVPITSDLIYVKLNEKGDDWIECTPADKCKKTRMIARDLNKWKKYKETDKEILSPTEWHKKEGASPPMIRIIDHRELAERKAALEKKRKDGPAEAFSLQQEIMADPISFLWHFPKLHKKNKRNPEWRGLSLVQVISLLKNDPVNKDFNKVFNFDALDENEKRDNPSKLVATFTNTLQRTLAFVKSNPTAVPDIKTFLSDMNYLQEYLVENNDDSKDITLACDEIYHTLSITYQNLTQENKALFLKALAPRPQKILPLNAAGLFAASFNTSLISGGETKEEQKTLEQQIEVNGKQPKKTLMEEMSKPLNTASLGNTDGSNNQQAEQKTEEHVDNNFDTITRENQEKSAPKKSNEITYAIMTEKGKIDLEKALNGYVGTLSRVFDFDIGGDFDPPAYKKKELVTPDLHAWATKLLQDTGIIDFSNPTQPKLNKIIEEHFTNDPDGLFMNFLPSFRAVTHTRLTDPCFDNGKLETWVQEFFPASVRHSLISMTEKFLKEVSKKAAEITFDPHTHQIRSWIFSVLGDNKLKKIIDKYGIEATSQQIIRATTAVVREAALYTYFTNQEEKDTHEKLKYFIFVIDQFFEHQYQYFYANMEKAISELSGRPSSIKPMLENDTANLIAEYKKIEPLFLENRFMDITKIITKTTQLITERNKNLVQVESIISHQDLPDTNKSNLFSLKTVFAKLTTNSRAGSNIPSSSSKKTILFSNKEREIGRVTIQESYSSDKKLSSELLNFSHDISALLYKDFVTVNSALSFNNEEEGKKFFHSLINTMHKNGLINTENIASFLKNNPRTCSENETAISEMASIILKSYQLNTEQLNPYKSTNDIFNSSYYFPNDLFIRTAAHHVDAFVNQLKEQSKKEQGKTSTPHILIKDAWDPHYVEAIQLYCHMKGYKCTNASGWKIDADNLEEKNKKFKEFFENRYGNITVNLEITSKATKTTSTNNNSLFKHKPSDGLATTEQNKQESTISPARLRDMK